MTVVAATLASSILLLLGTGLHPVPWLALLATLPVFWLAPRTSGRAAFAAAGLAWLLGQSRMWPYFLGTLAMPPLAVGAIIVGQALAFGLLTSAFRRLLRRGLPLTSTVTVAAGWVAFEYLVSLALPHGAWLSLAYTQADVPVVLQTAAVTGPWGITFLLLGVPALLAAGTAPGAAGRSRILVAGAVAVVLPLTFGTWRLRQPHEASTVRVALVATDRPNDSIDVATPAGRDLLDRYLRRMRDLPDANVVVLPEKTFIVNEATLPILADPLGRLAVERRQDIVVGVVLGRAGTSHNAAVGFPARGGPPVSYLKHHLVPGLEDNLKPGGGLAFVAPGRGLIICKDLDFPNLVREYRNRGAAVLLAPSWDFTDDGWLHSRMAVTRGVESGLAVARTSRAGRLTLSDPYGRVLAEQTSADADFVVVTGAVPARAPETPYGRFGDWFAWLCLLLLIPAAGLRPHRRPADHSDHAAAA